MNANKAKIVHFDVYYRIYLNYNHNFLITNYRERIAATIHANGDINLIEMYEIMNLPVIKLPKNKKPTQSQIWTKIFCCSCTRGSLSLNIFTGFGWQTYKVKP